MPGSVGVRSTEQSVDITVGAFEPNIYLNIRTNNGLGQLNVRYSLHLTITASRKEIIVDNIKTGLVMEGGAMRGLFTAGVIDVFMENDIEFDGAIGVSAGAAFGCNYKSHQIGRVLRYNLRFCKDPRFCSFRSFFKTGDLYGGDFCYRQIPDELDLFDRETFKNSNVKFYMVCTDVNTGKPVYYECTDGGEKDLKWMRASASMPGFSKVIHTDGYDLLDGGISDPVPLKYFQDIGYNRNVVILTQPRGYVKKSKRVEPLIKLILRKYPEIAKSMIERPRIYNQCMKYITLQEQAGDTYVIAPPYKLDIGKIEHNPEKIQTAYDIGRKTALENLEKVKAFLAGGKKD